MNTEETIKDSTKLLDILQDKRVSCWSVLASMQVSEYLQIVEDSYKRRGGIRHQRDALKTTSARRIRFRLVEDLKKGAIIPPVVIGLVLPEIDPLKAITNGEELMELLSKHSESLSIIDGMQRTTALLEAVKSAEFIDWPVRVEIWIAAATDSLVYRMLVLNTGQIPWNLKQQLNVVFEPLIQAIEKNVQFSRLLKRNDGANERRWKGGEFAAEDLVEAYIAFGLRRSEVETQEHLADEFSRLDMADAITSRKYDHYFYPVLQMMVDFDIAVSSFNPGDANEGRDSEDASGQGGRRKSYTRGRNIFDSQPARIGFVVAAATTILGRIGMDKAEDESTRKTEEVKGGVKALCEKVDGFNDEEREDFIALGVLSEVLMRKPTSAVGRWERNFFENAFKVLFEVNFELPSLEPCWRA